MSQRLYRLLLATGLAFAFSLGLAILDGLGWLVLPQPYRLAIPTLLVLSAFLGIVLLSGAIGIPKNPAAPAEADADEEREEAAPAPVE